MGQVTIERIAILLSAFWVLFLVGLFSFIYGMSRLAERKCSREYRESQWWAEQQRRWYGNDGAD